MTTSMNPIFQPNSIDVLFGPGAGLSTSHAGNKIFLRLVERKKEEYHVSDAEGRKTIVREIVNAVRSLNPPGRFLVRRPVGRCWHEASVAKTFIKINRALEYAYNRCETSDKSSEVNGDYSLEESSIDIKRMTKSLKKKKKSSLSYDSGFEERMADKGKP
eukprot:CAMPEP_0113315166 /NCGR_PEP_ID=MMETSP0010_2-20120614/10943_1 /TAXON_ID=216773 ORGANISM="Corethron hystrix, Strain 308" /NCGR_SAMPLE_ID=MMETSP0010_2 /ASSEMBLY_ACC=CAM_ASM_000155 /LENGTH=159 /DNA_ID=CAMNT_0000171613 /DNA_START=100 /DNA_END=579 /DNA_ORIENTATION=+ /assembly_acc=CAM_ASM_000155